MKVKAIVASIDPADAYYSERGEIEGKKVFVDVDDNYRHEHILFNGPFDIPEGHSIPEDDELRYSGYAYAFNLKIIE